MNNVQQPSSQIETHHPKPYQELYLMMALKGPRPIYIIMEKKRSRSGRCNNNYSFFGRVILIGLLLRLGEFSVLYYCVESFVVVVTPLTTTTTTTKTRIRLQQSRITRRPYCRWRRNCSRLDDERTNNFELFGSGAEQKINNSTNYNTRQPKQTGLTSLNASSLLFANNKNGQRPDKKKKNKYAHFSKTDNIDKDPLDVMLEESQQKLQALQDELNPIQRRKRQQEQAMASLPLKEVAAVATITNLEFPNTRDIDPYDPSTFGYIEIGTIQGPHSIHGYAKVRGNTDFPQRLTRPGTQLHIKPLRKRAPRPILLIDGNHIGGDVYLIQLQGIYDREMVQTMKGATLYYAKQQQQQQQQQQQDQMPLLSQNEIHISDLVGLSVYQETNDNNNANNNSRHGQLVGTVVGVVLSSEMCSIPGLLHDQMEVALIRFDQVVGQSQQQQQQQQLVLIPMVPEIIPRIDLEEKRIIINPPIGLLDLTYVREKKVKIKGLLAPANNNNNNDNNNNNNK
jgi:16S rRNA processing protein RimM